MNHILDELLDHNHLAVFLILLVISILMAEFFYWKPVKEFITKTIW